MDAHGQYGGRVLRPFVEGHALTAGDLLTPEAVAAWPLLNRVSLQRTGMVEWFNTSYDWDTSSEAPPAKTATRSKRR